jgi:outer membrane protein
MRDFGSREKMRDVMNLRWQTAVYAAVVVAGLAPASVTRADDGKSAGDIMVRLRGLGVLPDVSSSVGVIGGHVGASNTAVPEIDGTYFFTDNIAVELIAATTQHTMTDDGSAIGHVNIGKVRLLPPTLTAQYHFMPKALFSPYVGAGLNYTFFFDSKPAGGTVTSAKYESGLGYALQAGVDYRINATWYVNFDVKKIFLNTKVHLNGGTINASVDLDPWLVGLGVGYKF